MATSALDLCWRLGRPAVGSEEESGSDNGKAMLTVVIAASPAREVGSQAGSGVHLHGGGRAR